MLLNSFMTRPRVRLLRLSLLLWLASTHAHLCAEPIHAEWDDVGRIVVIADLHGDFAQFTDLLQESGVVNRRFRWKGGDTHLVQLGDVVDRGQLR